MEFAYDWLAAAREFNGSGLSLRQFWEQRAHHFSRGGYVPAYSTMTAKLKQYTDTAAQLQSPRQNQEQRGNLRVVDMTTTEARANLQPAPVRLLQPKPAPMRLMRLTLPNGTVMELQPEHPDELALKILDRVWGAS